MDKKELFEKVIKLTDDKPNDMDLGKAVRMLVIEYLLDECKPPFTEDYTQ